MTERLSLAPGIELSLRSDDDGWQIEVTRPDGTPCGPGDGASETLIGLLQRGGTIDERWQSLRLATIPPVSGERAIAVDQTNTSVVVGETVVVKWLRTVADQPHPALAALAQLSAVGFDQTPTPYAVLTWTSASGHTLPVAYVTDYLTGAEDGWTWCVRLLKAQVLGDHADPWADDVAQRLGRLTAELHIALATPTHVFPRPVQPAGATRAQRWYDGALAMLERALLVSDPACREVVAERAEAIAACFDRDLGDDRALATSPVQHVHGDLHVGQLLRWREGLAVVDFDGNPVVAPGGGLIHPPARDVAQMLRSLAHVGRIVLLRSPETDPLAVRAWMSESRDDYLDAYRNALQESGMTVLLDERLLPAFELEQELRELVYADRHLPRWSYAPVAGLRDLLPR